MVLGERTDSASRDSAAAFGTLVHHWAETGRVDLKSASKADIKCLQDKLELTGIKRDTYWPKATGGQHEMTFAYNLLTLEVRWYEGKRAGADDWKGELREDHQWMTATVDWVEPYPGRIDDLKTGRWPVEAEDNKQLLSCAMAWWLEAGRPQEYSRPLSITQWPRYPKHGLPAVNYGNASALDLEAHLQDLRWSLDHPDETNVDFDSCRFCDGKPNCPDFILSGINYSRG